MKVVSYYNVVPAVNKSQEKFDILTKFIQGVNAAGDTGILHTGYDIVDADVGLIQGWQHQQGKAGSHLQLRQKVIETQLRKKQRVCVADANLFLYANKTNQPHHYLRYSYDGVFPNTGEYFDSAPNTKRWQQISRDTGIILEPQKTKGKNIVVCLQRHGGWSMGRISVVDWTLNTIKEIRKYSDRPIILRPHPKDNKAIRTYIPQITQMLKGKPNISISTQNTPLEIDLSNAWAVVNHNSSAVVGPIIQGFHSFITDPEKSQCTEVSHIGFKNIETPIEFDRQKWLERISMFHWKFSELQDGTAWKHMREFV